MVRDLALAETTPGPLTVVVQFAAFRGALHLACLRSTQARTAATRRHHCGLSAAVIHGPAALDRLLRRGAQSVDLTTPHPLTGWPKTSISTLR